MSLLLDALKKAAKDKQQVISSSSEAGEDLELTLDEQVLAEESHQVESQGDSSEKEALAAEPVPSLEKTTATTSTVSDEALQLLVYKTNKQYRRKQKIVWGSALAATLFMLIVGGVYYYYVMVEEVEALERKHDIAMRLFKSNAITNSREKPVVVNKVQPAKQVVVNKNTTKTAAPKKVKSPVPKKAEKVFSIQRTEKLNPISVLLNKGWVAYGSADYEVATDAYRQVLQREPRNRDALLGMAAIAVKQGDYIQAKAFYNKLVKLDPRDQIALSALSNLDDITPDLFGETKLKFMVQRQPDAPHLHFALGNFYARQGRWPEAQSEYFSAWQGSAENPDYAFNLAVSLDQIGKREEAKRFYETSLKLSVGNNVNFSVQAVKERLSQLAEK